MSCVNVRIAALQDRHRAQAHGRVLAAVCEDADPCEHGGERGTQLVRQDGEKCVLGLIGALRFDTGGFRPPEPPPLLFRHLALRDVVEYQNHPQHSAVGVPDGCAAVVDRDLTPISRDEDGVVGKPHKQPVAQHAQRGALDLLAGVGVDDPEHFPQGPSPGLDLAPAGERLGDGVLKNDRPGRVRRDHRIADAVERGSQTLLLLPRTRLGDTRTS